MAEESPEHGPTDQGDGEPAHEPTEISYAEYLHPARPRSLRHRPRVTSPVERRSVAHDGPANGENPAYVDWLRSQSMLADANEISRQLSGQGTMWQNPFANPGPRQAVDTASVWFTAYPISLITRPGELVPGRAGRRGAVEGLRHHRDRRPPHRPRQARGRDIGLAVHAQRRRPLRPHQHPDRPGVRQRDRVPGDVRHGDVVRRHDHRRRRARPHRQGRGLPARRDEGRRLPRHLPHGRDRARGLEPPARRPGGPGLGQHRHLDRGLAREGGLHHRPPATGDLLRRGRQGDQLERHPAGRRPRRRRAALGLPALLQGRPALDQLAGPLVRGHADGDRRRPALPRPTSGPAACAWTPTASSAWRRAPRARPPGPRATRSPRPRTSSSAAWCARSAASPSKS